MNTTTLTWHCKPFQELNTTELYAILKIRMEVFIVEQHCYYLDLDEVDKRCLHIYATGSEQNIVAYARAIPPGEMYKQASFGRVVVNPLHRHSGLGRTLTSRAIQVIRDHYQNPDIKISAQSHLEKFYASFGFRISGPEYMDAGIPHLPMVLQA